MSQQITNQPDFSDPAIFDHLIDRTVSDSSKWAWYGPNVLPLWVADMDFASPRPILDALHERIDHGVFGYGMEPRRLRELFCARMASLYNWSIEPEHIVFLPGLVAGLNLAARAVGEPGSGIMTSTPIYPPFLSAPLNQDRICQAVPLASSQRHDAQGRSSLHYQMDFDALNATVQPNTRLYMLCNPHNPTGQVYSREELQELGDFCLRHDLLICSDDIHCDLLLGGTKHMPIASLSQEIADRTITLMAPSKTFNIPGLGCSMAIIPNAELRQQVNKAAAGIVPHVNLLGYVAAIAAYEKCGGWLATLLDYLTANRDFVFDYVHTNLPGVEMTQPEATYLAWLDFRQFALPDPFQFFLDDAKVALNAGRNFGKEGEGFVRLNFGCPRNTLAQALDRMAAALAKVAV